MKTLFVDDAGIFFLICLLTTLYSVISNIRKQTSLYDNRSVDIAAGCASILCLICIGVLFVVPTPSQEYQAVSLTDTSGPEEDGNSRHLLNIGTILGYASLASILLMFLGQYFQNKNSHDPSNDQDQNTLSGESHPHSGYER
jgi:hypothetical protein